MLRPLLFTAAVAVFMPQWALACNVTIGTVKLESGDVESTSVVKGMHAEAVLTSDGEDKLEAFAESNKDAPVPVQVGTYRNTVALADALKDDTLTIPGKNTSEGLVLQQELKRCL